jgi:hypothetical protein
VTSHRSAERKGVSLLGIWSVLFGMAALVVGIGFLAEPFSWWGVGMGGILMIAFIEVLLLTRRRRSVE